ncbi:cation transporter, partial [Mycena haematopus]
MVSFQGAYPMIFSLMFVILAGNHALVWIWYKIERKGSETSKTLSFLLQHPRRCFLYLFPSHQTWFLVICLVGFSAVEWVAFESLDSGLPFFEEMTKGPRIVDGLFQGLAARASGLAIVPVASASPALQFLYVVMMYIAVYPVAMTIRSTNVYESESLGVFEEPPDEEDEEPVDLDKIEPREALGRYLKWHLDRQISIDIWWLVWGVFLVAIIERHNLLDQDKKWFDMFRILFELVSAFAGIGLSLGLPTDNFS